MESDLISRSALLDELQEELDFDTPMYDEEQNKLINTGLRIAVKDVKRKPAVDAVDIEKALAWLEDYSILDRHEVYTNGVLLVPLFRVEQAFVHKAYNGFREG